MDVERVCVTGGTGFVANHIIKALLDHPDNYTVVTTLRGSKEGFAKRLDDSILGEFSRKYGDRLVFISADLLVEGSFDKAVSGCQYVLHVASPVTQNAKDVYKDLIKPAVRGTLNVLGACSRSDTVKRVILTSSVAAIADPSPSTNGKHKDESDWNETASPTVFPYSYSKTEAEKKAWEFVKSQDKFDMVVVNPALVLGPVLHKNQLNDGSASVVTSIIRNDFMGVLNMSMTLIHVEDIAKAQIWAMKSPKAKGRYVLALPKPTTLSTMVDILSKHFPNHYFSKIPIPNWSLYLAMPFDSRLSTSLIASLHLAPVFSPAKYETDSGNKLRGETECLIDTAESLKPFGVFEKKTNTKLYLLAGAAALAGIWYFYF